MYPALDMTWGAWQALHPGTKVLSDQTGSTRDYTRFPMGDYEQTDEIWFELDVIDDRRGVKERVLGIPERGDAGAVALPFDEMAQASEGGLLAIELEAGQGDAVVLWDENGWAAAAFVPVVDGERFTIRAKDGRFVDEETGSEWTIGGRAVEGQMSESGAALVPVAEAYVAFWFAWAAFHPETEIWEK